MVTQGMVTGDCALGAQQETSGQNNVLLRSWRLGLWLKAGYPYSGSRIGRPSTTDVIPNRPATVSTLEPSGVGGVGVEISVPGHDVAVRLGWEASLKGTISGQPAICEFFDGDLCRPETAAITTRTLVTQVRLEAGRNGATVRPVILGGFDVRWLSVDPPICSPVTEDPRARVCRDLVGSLPEPGAHLFLGGGLGLQASVGVMRFELAGLAGVGRYRRGTALTAGPWYHELRAEVATSATIF